MHDLVLQFSQWAESIIDSHGTLAVVVMLMISGVGIAISEEIVLIPAGVLVAHGKLELAPLLLGAYVAIVCADTLWFFICRRVGTTLFHIRGFRRLAHPRRLLEAKYRLDHSGPWFIALARFIPSSRSLAISVAGIFRMPVWKFLLPTVTCVMLTTPLQVGMGFLIGRNMAEEQEFASLLVRLLLIVAIIIALVIVGQWVMQSRTGGIARRARAFWIRGRRKNDS